LIINYWGGSLRPNDNTFLPWQINEAAFLPDGLVCLVFVNGKTGAREERIYVGVKVGQSLELPK
jgi:hypothetical protein